MSRILPIKNIGLKLHLDETAAKHRGFSYFHFVQMLNAKTGVSAMARNFNVDPRTMHKWIKIYQTELSENKH